MPGIWGNFVFVTTATPVGEKITPKMRGRPVEHDNAAVSTKQLANKLSFVTPIEFEATSSTRVL